MLCIYINILQFQPSKQSILFIFIYFLFITGHKFAGNVICYIHEGQTGIWYGRVNTCHCRAIIEDTICAGKVIKELYRGAMSHSFGEIKSDRLRW